MNLAAARTLITQTLSRMNALYNQTVFDEWILAVLDRDKGAILSCYDGPRAEVYQRNFKEDVLPIRNELKQHRLEVGDLFFVDTGVSTRFDACLRVGQSSYLFLNNIGKSMADIRKSPFWLDAQKPFVDLSSKFRADPLE